MAKQSAISPLDEVGQFLDGVSQTVGRGDTDGATDTVFDRFDELLDRGDYAACDQILRRTDMEELDSNLMVAILVITLPAKGHLAERDPLYRRVKRALMEDRGEDAAGELLQGLERLPAPFA
jgi:hypothetical protein